MSDPTGYLPSTGPQLSDALFTTSQLIWFAALPAGRQTQLLDLLLGGSSVNEAIARVSLDHRMAPDLYPDDD